MLRGSGNTLSEVHNTPVGERRGWGGCPSTEGTTSYSICPTEMPVNKTINPSCRGAAVVRSVVSQSGARTSQRSPARQSVRMKKTLLSSLFGCTVVSFTGNKMCHKALLQVCLKNFHHGFIFTV